jgi:hypothetical protein
LCATHFFYSAFSRSKLFFVFFFFRSSASGVFLLDDFSLGLHDCVPILVLGLRFSFLRAQCIMRSSVPQFFFCYSSIFLCRPSGFGPFFYRSSVLGSHAQVFRQRFSFLDSARSFIGPVSALTRELILRLSALIFAIHARSDPTHMPDLNFRSRCLA